MDHWAVVYLQIDVGISLDQGRANIAVAFLAGDRQGRAAIFVQRVHVWFPFQQLRDHMDGVATRRHQQGRPTILFGVDRRSIVCETDARGRGRVGGGGGGKDFRAQTIPETSTLAPACSSMSTMSV